MLYSYDNREIKTKISTYFNKFYTTFRSLNVPEDDMIESSESWWHHRWQDVNLYSLFYWFFTFIQKQILHASIFRQLFWKRTKQMADYLDDNLFETDEN